MARKNKNQPVKELLLPLFLVLLLLSVFWPKRNIISEWQRKEAIEAEINFWEKTAEQYPGDGDAFLRLAVLHWQVHQQATAADYLEKARYLNPNSEKIKEVEGLIADQLEAQ